jgi:Kazal-type serine protease inhibitor domain
MKKQSCTCYCVRGLGFTVVQWIAVVVSCVLTIACVASSVAEEKVGRLDAEPCSNPRPDNCPQSYAPVCGSAASGATATYSNACMACANLGVAEWTPGACITTK